MARRRKKSRQASKNRKIKPYSLDKSLPDLSPGSIQSRTTISAASSSLDPEIVGSLTPTIPKIPERLSSNQKRLQEKDLSSSVSSTQPSLSVLLPLSASLGSAESPKGNESSPTKPRASPAHTAKKSGPPTRPSREDVPDLQTQLGESTAVIQSSLAGIGFSPDGRKSELPDQHTLSRNPSLEDIHGDMLRKSEASEAPEKRKRYPARNFLFGSGNRSRR